MCNTDIIVFKVVLARKQNLNLTNAPFSDCNHSPTRTRCTIQDETRVLVMASCEAAVVGHSESCLQWFRYITAKP